jgi:flagellar basal body-associated protein FliL
MKRQTQNEIQMIGGGVLWFALLVLGISLLVLVAGCIYLAFLFKTMYNTNPDEAEADGEEKETMTPEEKTEMEKIKRDLKVRTACFVISVAVNLILLGILSGLYFSVHG